MKICVSLWIHTATPKLKTRLSHAHSFSLYLSLHIYLPPALARARRLTSFSPCASSPFYGCPWRDDVTEDKRTTRRASLAAGNTRRTKTGTHSRSLPRNVSGARARARVNKLRSFLNQLDGNFARRTLPTVCPVYLSVSVDPSICLGVGMRDRCAHATRVTVRHHAAPRQ